jgi:hypothetical protein
VCQVSAPELFSAHHAAAHTASEPSLRVSRSLGVSQPGRAPPADCPVDEAKATLSAYDELPVEIDSLRGHKPQDRLSIKQGQAHERFCTAVQKGQSGYPLR